MPRQKRLLQDHFTIACHKPPPTIANFRPVHYERRNSEALALAFFALTESTPTRRRTTTTGRALPTMANVAKGRNPTSLEASNIAKQSSTSLRHSWRLSTWLPLTIVGKTSQPSCLLLGVHARIANASTEKRVVKASGAVGVPVRRTPRFSHGPSVFS